jgi:hypothetical protein
MADKKKPDGEAAVLEKIDGWPEPHREMGRRLHEIITEAAPDLKPRLWYGMPGYARSGPVLCHFIAEGRMAFGLSEKAPLLEDDATGGLTPSGWFITELDAAAEKRIAEIVRTL